MDYEDVSRLIEYNSDTGQLFWKVSRGCMKAGSEIKGKCDGYIVLSLNKKSYKGHRIAWLLYHRKWPDDLIDHINNDRGDNRIVNLRECNRQGNNSNVPNRVDNKSGVKGVSWKSSHERWCAQISFKGKVMYLGLFENIGDAEKVVKEKRIELHKEFANHG